MRWGLILGIGMALDCALFVGCDSIDRDAPPRFYVAPDANDPTTNPQNPSDDSGPTASDADGAPGTDSPVTTVFDPATLPLTGWWRAGFAVPWVGVASAGTSKGHDLAEATNPPIASTPINGLAPAGFDGVNDVLGSTVPVNMYLSTTGWEAHGLFSADSAKPYVAGTAYNFPTLLGDNSAGDFYIAFSSAGVMAGHWDNAVFREIVAPCPTGGLHTFDAWFDGAKLNLSIDGAAPVTPVPTGTPNFGTGLLRIGTNFAGTATFDGRIVEIMLAAKVLDAPARAGIRSYFNYRYNTAFPTQ